MLFRYRKQGDDARVLDHAKYVVPMLESSISPGLKKGRVVRRIVCMLITMLSLICGPLAPAYAADVQYVYDELGRLIQVISADGNSAQYRYDSVGNIIAVEKHAANALSISEFTPDSGSGGTAVVIYGSGFKVTAGDNSVKFNGSAAVVSAATGTRLNVTVPAGATTGKITVSNSNGTATSATDFVVGAAAAPAITSFSPVIGALGTTVTISGANFQASRSANKVSFGALTASVLSASATSIDTAVPSAAASGKITVATPKGRAVSNADFYAVPSGLTVADIEYTGRLFVNGAPQSVTINTPGKKALLIFDGAQLQNLSLLGMGGTFASEVSVAVYRPDGSALSSGNLPSNDTVDLARLSTTGTYTMVLSPVATDKGKIDLQLKAEATGSIVINGAVVPVSLTPGQNGRYTFSAVAGQNLTVTYTGVSINPATKYITYSVYKPDGTLLFRDFWSSSNRNALPTLPATGTYALQVDPQGVASANVTLTLSAEMAAGTLVVDGPSASFSTTRVGQNGRFTFAGTAGQTLGLGIPGLSTVPAAQSLIYTIYNPDGSALFSDSWSSSNSNNLPVLPVSGNYSLLVSQTAGVTSATTTVILSSDVVGTMSINGAGASFATTRVGQNGRYSFSGTAGQNLKLSYSAVSTAPAGQSIRYYVYKPDGSALFGDAWSGNNSNNLPALPVSGNYTVFVDPAGAVSGANVTLSLSGDIDAGVLVVDGPARTFSTTRAENGRFTFAGTAGQRLGLGYTGVSTVPAAQSIIYTVYKPDGTVLFGDSWTTSNSNDLPVLPVSGTYSIFISPAAGVSSATTTLILSSDLVGTLAVNGATANFASTRTGQNGRYSFSGTAGQNLKLSYSAVSATPSGQSIRYYVYKPDGSMLFGDSWSNNASNTLPTLPASGTYTIVVDPAGATSSANVTLSLSGDVAAGALVVDGPSRTFSTTRAENGRFTFEGTAGQTLGLGYTGVSTVPASQSLVFTIYKPDGGYLFSDAWSDSNSNNLPVLPVSGTYSILVAPAANVSSATATLILSSDLVGTMAVNGATATFATTRAGQNGRYVFSGTAGQNLKLSYSGVSTAPAGQSIRFYVNKPDGTTLFADSWSNNNSNTLPALPVSGSYTVVVDPAGATNGANVTLSLIGEVAAGALTVDGPARTFSTTRAENGRFTFEGTAGQTLGLGYTGVSTVPASQSIIYTVYKPDGGYLFSDSWSDSNSNNLPVLPVSGTYSILVAPAATVGSAASTLTLSSDLAGTLAVNGATATFATTRAGQNGRYAFTGTAGQTLKLSYSGFSTAPAGQSIRYYLYSPNGNLSFIDSWSNNNSNTLPALSASGTYTVFVDPAGAANAATVTLGLTVNAPAAKSITN